MINLSINQIIIMVTLTLCISSYRHSSSFLTFNTSGHPNGLSVSISTNINHEFSIYSPILFDTVQNNTVKFTPSVEKKKLILEPDNENQNNKQVLYNDYSQTQYWYGFKKQTNGEDKKNQVFAINIVNINNNNKQSQQSSQSSQQSHNQSSTFLMPMFNLPLSFLPINTLFHCSSVLVSFHLTPYLIDIVIFSQSQQWSLSPQANWGFRNKDNNVYFSRQTYSLGSKIQVKIGKNNQNKQQYCQLNEEIIKQNINKNLIKFDVKESYTLKQLLEKYSQQLQVKVNEDNVKIQQEINKQGQNNNDDNVNKKVVNNQQL